MINFDTLIAKVDDFPTLPTIYTSLMKKTSDPRSTVQDVAEVIQSDQATAIRILKLVNSPVYSLNNKVETISQAIFHIGFNEVKNIVLAHSIVKIMGSGDENNSFNIVELWKHSIATGVISRLIAQKLGIKNVENFFISGILHDIGKLFFIKVFKQIYFDMVENSIEKKINLCEIEKAKFTADHTHVGELLSKKWKLPDSIQNVIRYHDVGTIDGKFDMLVAVVHLANIIAKMMNYGNSGNTIINEPNFDIWDEINPKPGSFTEMYKEIKSNYSQAVSILTVNK